MNTMKTFLFLLLIMPFLSAAQECKLIRETDPYTKEKVLSTGFISLQGASLSIDANKQEIDFLFTISGGEKCFNDLSTVAIYFEGTKVKQTQRNNAGMNCEGIFRMTFRNSSTPPVLLRRMATQKTEQFVFIDSNKKETVISLKPEQQQMLLQLAACLQTEAPALL